MKVNLSLQLWCDCGTCNELIDNRGDPFVLRIHPTIECSGCGKPYTIQAKLSLDYVGVVGPREWPEKASSNPRSPQEVQNYHLES
jgi:hypothetical protein